MSAYEERLVLGSLLFQQPGFHCDEVKVGDHVHVTVPDFAIDDDYCVLEVGPDGAVSLERIPARGADTPATEEDANE